jgi:hypothetical protein
VAALLQRAAEAQPGVVRWAGAIGGLIVFALTSRFYFAAPASVESGRVLAFQSWAQTRGNMLRIMLGRLVLLGPALVFVLALSMSAAEFARSQVAVVALAVIWASAFVQMAVHSSLETGLSVGLYRRLSATAAAKA